MTSTDIALSVLIEKLKGHVTFAEGEYVAVPVATLRASAEALAALSQPAPAQGGVTEAERQWPACLDPNTSHNRRSAYKEFRRSQIAQLRPYEAGEDLADVSISAPDKEAGSPKVGDMIARNPKNHADKWLVAAQYFADNFEPLAAISAPSAPVEAIRTAWLISYADQSADLCFTEEEADELVADAKPGATKTPLASLSVQQQTWRPTHRHVKTGGEYMLLGAGKMQAENWYDQGMPANASDSGLRPVDMREVAIYRDADGNLWVRPVEEFNDGRFVPLPATPVQKDGA